MKDTTSIAWLGLDAHSKNCVLGQLDDHGTEINWWRLPTQTQKLIAQVQAIPYRLLNVSSLFRDGIRFLRHVSYKFRDGIN